MRILTFLLYIVSSLCMIRAAVQISKCSNNLPVPREFRFNDCIEKICVGSIDDQIKLGVDFEAQHSSEKLMLKLALNVMGYTFDHELHNICNYIVDNTCPLTIGQNYTMSNNIQVPKAAKGYFISSTVYLADQNDNRHFCFKFQFRLS